MPQTMEWYLSFSANKENFFQIFVLSIETKFFAPYFKGILYMTHGEFCHHLIAEDGQVICTTVDKLCSSHEVADTRPPHASCISCFM